MADKPIGLDLPMISLVCQTLPEGWEKAVMATWKDGIQMPTQYDRPGDPPSRDSTLCLSVARPFEEPRLHRAMPGGIYDLEVYVQEVVDGIHDHWIDPASGKWGYTYHERLTAYSVGGGQTVDQLRNVVDTIAAAPMTRRAQAIVWNPRTDPQNEHCPCLQRLWFRLVENRLVLNVHIRSNDAFKAAFMNMYAFTEIQARVALKLSERMDREIVPGQYNHIADSFHIYGSYFEDFKGFLESVKVRHWDQRTYTTESMQVHFDEARVKIADKLAKGQRASEEKK